MKTNKQISLFASRLAILALALVTVFNLTACSDDEKEALPGIVGEWVNGDASYFFSKNKTGQYESGGDVWGDFTYTFNESGVKGSVHLKVTYMNRENRGVWRNEISGSYDTAQGKLWINNKEYVKH